MLDPCASCYSQIVEAQKQGLGNELVEELMNGYFCRAKFLNDRYCQQQHPMCFQLFKELRLPRSDFLRTSARRFALLRILQELSSRGRTESWTERRSYRFGRREGLFALLHGNAISLLLVVVDPRVHNCSAVPRFQTRQPTAAARGCPKDAPSAGDGGDAALRKWRFWSPSVCGAYSLRAY